MIRRATATLPVETYLTADGEPLVAGPHGKGHMLLSAWLLANKRHTQPDYMINVAGVAMEQREIRDISQKLIGLSPDTLTALHDLLDIAVWTDNPCAYFRVGITENASLAAALKREKLVDGKGIMNPRVEFFLLHQKFPDFFQQRPQRNRFRPALTAGDVLENMMRGQQSLTLEQCSPWTVLAEAQDGNTRPSGAEHLALLIDQ